MFSGLLGVEKQVMKQGKKVPSSFCNFNIFLVFAQEQRQYFLRNESSTRCLLTMKKDDVDDNNK